MENMNKIIIYTDGGSRGNPGPAAIAFVIAKANLELRIKNLEFSKSIGKATNNEAEYQAIIFAFKKIKHFIGGNHAEKTEIEINSDSELLVKQLNGKYKIKEEKLIPFFIEIWNLKQNFKKVEFIQIPREENKKADALVNRELDSQNKLF